MARELLSTEEVAHRLGVKRATVYAYVSRGLLERHVSSSHRRSLFERDAVERLAARARRTDSSGALEVVVETQITRLDPAGRLAYRGHDAVELARFRSCEQVAGLLWDGDPGAPWELDGPSRALLARVRDAIASPVLPTERIPVAVAVLGASDPDAADRRPDAVRRAGSRILAGALEAFPSPTSSPDRGAAARLLTALRRVPTGSDPFGTRSVPDARSSRASGDGVPMGSDSCGRPRPAQRAAIDAALVLLADHELAASTLAARVAASAQADPYRVVLAGLGPLGGRLHGAASLAAEDLFASLDGPERAHDVLAAVASAGGGGVPGFGRHVYRDRDPRADHLLARVATVADDGAAADRVTAVLAAARALGLPAPNVDLALAALTHVMGLERGAATAIFTVARLVGLIAHALEEYPHHLRFRPRAHYVGPVLRRS